MTGDTMFRDPTGHVFPDTAFEPQSGFMFEEPAANEDEFRTMQRNIASLNVMPEHTIQRDFQQILDDGDANSQLQRLQQQTNFVQPMFFNNRGDTSNSLAWSKSQSPLSFQPQSAQSHIANGRASVSQQYGQITPPDEYSTSDFPTSSRGHADQPLSSKSERARNAANQRHAKAKKARKDSIRSKGESVDDDEEIVEGGDRREKYREKNRLAAAKCRAKKKTHTEDLEESARVITATNSRLRAEERELRDLFSSLRHEALAHDPTQGCNCTAIHTYNHHKAQEAARGAAMSVGVMGAIPSPSMTSEGSAVPSPGLEPMTASRAQSFSARRPSMPSRHETRTRSLAGQVGYLPPMSGMMHQALPNSVISANETDEDMAEFSQDLC